MVDLVARIPFARVTLKILTFFPCQEFYFEEDVLACHATEEQIGAREQNSYSYLTS